jgi:hypothetical protein
MVNMIGAKALCGLIAVLLLGTVPAKMDAQTPALVTGIEGVISVSPTHGGPTRQGEADSAPLANTIFEVTNAAGAATTFTTDSAGRFRVPLPPGRYTIKGRDAKKFPRCGPFEVEVTTAGFNKVRWDCDSGMR